MVEGESPIPHEDPKKPVTLSRRNFLKLGGAVVGAGALAVAGVPLVPGSGAEVAQAAPAEAAPAAESLITIGTLRTDEQTPAEAAWVPVSPVLIQHLDETQAFFVGEGENGNAQIRTQDRTPLPEQKFEGISGLKVRGAEIYFLLSGKEPVLVGSGIKDGKQVSIIHRLKPATDEAPEEIPQKATDYTAVALAEGSGVAGIWQGTDGPKMDFYSNGSSMDRAPKVYPFESAYEHPPDAEISAMTALVPAGGAIWDKNTRTEIMQAYGRMPLKEERNTNPQEAREQRKALRERHRALVEEIPIMIVQPKDTSAYVLSPQKNELNQWFIRKQDLTDVRLPTNGPIQIRSATFTGNEFLLTSSAAGTGTESSCVHLRYAPDTHTFTTSDVPIGPQPQEQQTVTNETVTPLTGDVPIPMYVSLSLPGDNGTTKEIDTTMDLNQYYFRYADVTGTDAGGNAVHTLRAEIWQVNRPKVTDNPDAHPPVRKLLGYGDFPDSSSRPFTPDCQPWLIPTSTETTEFGSQRSRITISPDAVTGRNTIDAEYLTVVDNSETEHTVVASPKSKVYLSLVINQ